MALNSLISPKHNKTNEAKNYINKKSYFVTSKSSKKVVKITSFTVSPAERCDLVGVKLEKVDEVFKFGAFLQIEGEVFYNMAQYNLSFIWLCKMAHADWLITYLKNG